MAKSDRRDKHLRRVRTICLALPDTFEKVSHGAPTFFGKNGVFCMFADNHHNDGHLAVWIPAEPGAQQALIRSDPQTYFRPPYVGPSGWVGIELDPLGDDDLGMHLHEAWRLIAAKKRGKKNAG